MDLEREVESLKNALEYAINDYKFLIFTKEKLTPEGLVDILKDHEGMAKRWKLNIRKVE